MSYTHLKLMVCVRSHRNETRTTSTHVVHSSTHVNSCRRLIWLMSTHVVHSFSQLMLYTQRLTSTHVVDSFDSCQLMSYTHLNASCLLYEWVMSMNESRVMTHLDTNNSCSMHTLCHKQVVSMNEQSCLWMSHESWRIWMSHDSFVMSHDSYVWVMTHSCHKQVVFHDSFVSQTSSDPFTLYTQRTSSRGCFKLQVSFRKWATNYEALLRKMTCHVAHTL